MKKILLCMALATSLAGCANLKFQWSASYMTDNLKADLQPAEKPAVSSINEGAKTP